MELTSRKPVLETLQVLRGLAAILITANHALYEVGLMYPVAFQVPDYRHYVLAIDVFFVLSGFIMVYTTAGKQGVSDAKDFALRRLIRIVPLYWFYTFFLVAVALIMPQVLGEATLDFGQLVKSLLFIPYINPAGDSQPFLAVGWSLNYEMYFYAVFTVCMFLPRRFLMPALAGYFLFTVFVVPHFMSGHIVMDFYTHDIVLEFLAGAFIGFLYLKGVRLPKVLLWPAFSIAALLGLGVFFPDVFYAIFGVDYPRGIVAVFIVACLIFPKGAEFLRAPWGGKFSGDASYTIYLSHAFFIGGVTQLAMLFGFDTLLYPWVVFLAVMGACIVGGGLLYLGIERPMTELFKSIIKKKVQGLVI